MDNKLQRGAFLAALKAGFKELKPLGAKTSVSQDRVKLTFSNGATGQLYATVVHAGAGRDGFDVYTGVKLEGAPARDRRHGGQRVVQRRRD